MPKGRVEPGSLVVQGDNTAVPASILTYLCPILGLRFSGGVPSSAVCVTPSLQMQQRTVLINNHRLHPSYQHLLCVIGRQWKKGPRPNPHGHDIGSKKGGSMRQCAIATAQCANTLCCAELLIGNPTRTN